MVSKLWPKIITSTPHHHHHQDDQRCQPSISVQLLESVLYTHTGNNPILRGVVEINIKHPVVVSSLRLDFKGHLAYHLVKPDLSCEKDFAQCSLPLYPAPTAVNTISSSALSKPLVIGGENSKPTRFVFEMPLLNSKDAGDGSRDQQILIQSTKCKEFQVKYQVSAILEYQPYISPSLPPQSHAVNNKRRASVMFATSHPQPITVVQIPIYEDGSPFLTNDCMLASIDSRKQSNQWCQYHVKVDKRFAAISSMLTLSVHLAPLIQGLKLNQVSMQLVQHFTITDDDAPQTSSRAPIPLDCHYQSTPYPTSVTDSGGALYEGQFRFKIPSNTPPTTSKWARPDESSDQANPAGLVPSIQTHPVSKIKVSHHLLVNLTLSYPKLSQDGIVRQARRLLTFQCDFDLLPPCMADHMSDTLLRLPAYESPSPALKTQQKHQQYTRIAKELLHCRRLHALPEVESPPPMYDQAIRCPPATTV